MENDPDYLDAVTGPYRLAVLMGYISPAEAVAAELEVRRSNS